MKHCFYYGKNVPEDYGADVGHTYEKKWVQFHFGNDDYLLNETIYYIRAGLGDLCANDGVPISMKAILFNRFCHWGYGETPDTFRRWYESIDYTNTRIKVNEPRNVSLNYYNPLLISAVLGDIAGSIIHFQCH